jgi:hypothetical protein
MTMILDGTNGAFLPTWTTGTRPASPANGQIGYNSTTGQIDQYVGSAWSSVPTAGASQATATALGTVYAKQTTGGGTPFLTAFGYNAGVSTTGANCVAIGTDALFTNTSAANSTAVGYQAAYKNILGSVTAIGYQAGYNDVNPYGATDANVYVGYQAGYKTTTGNGQTFIGVTAGYNKLSGGICTFVGNAAGYGVTTGIGNTCLGYGTMYNATTISYSVAIGDRCMAVGVATGTYNTGIGQTALNALTSGNYNTATGGQALNVVTTGTGNTAYGMNSLVGVLGGDYNTGIGYGAGNGLTSGANSTYIGYNSLPSASANNYELVVGVNSTGKGNSTGYINAASGGTYNGANTTTWATTSDRRLKKNIVDNNVGLDKISQIQVRNFEYRTEDEVTDLPKHSVIKKEGVQLGAIAQEMLEILPDCVKTETTGVMSLNTDSIMWHMINAIKELNAKVIALETKLGV